MEGDYGARHQQLYKERILLQEKTIYQYHIIASQARIIHVKGQYQGSYQ